MASLRSRLDFELYHLKLSTTLQNILDLAILGTSIFLLISDYSKPGRFQSIQLTTAMLFLFSTFKVLYSCWKYFRRQRQSSKVKGAILKEEDILQEEILPSHKERQLGFEVQDIKAGDKHEKVFFSRPLNEYLIQNNELLIKVNQAGYRQVKASIKNRRDNLIHFLNYGFHISQRDQKTFINQKKLCLSEDIRLDSPYVRCHKGGYFDSLLTNQRYGRYLVSAENEELVLADARQFFPIKFEGGDLVLQDITESDLNHHIGISTLAFTQSNYLVLWAQNYKNQMSEGMLAPSGSGSADFKDLRKNEKGAYSFQESITCAMERELREESMLDMSLKEAVVKETKIIGYFRWYSRGGKPEFVGITKLKESILEMTPNFKEVQKKYPYTITHIDEVPELIQKVRSEQGIILSVPLQLNLMFLEDYYHSHKKELAELLGL